MAIASTANNTPMSTHFKQVGSNLLHWIWMRALAYWIVFSAGTMSELLFLGASIWKSVNASDHAFVLLFLNESQATNITYWANSIYIVLSVCILPLAAYTSYGHIKMWMYHKTWRCSSALWAMLYGAPTITFLVIDIAIISNSNATYTLPDYLISARSIMAYTYGLTAILYHFAGKSQEADRLQKKDMLIGELQANIEAFIGQIADLKRESDQQRQDAAAELARQKLAFEKEIEGLKQQLGESKTAQRRLIEEMNRTDEDALQAYGAECIVWLKSGVKSVEVEEIVKHTGHSKRKITSAIDNGNLRTAPNGKRVLVLVSSLVEWLKVTPLPERKTDTMPALHVVNS